MNFVNVLNEGFTYQASAGNASTLEINVPPDVEADDLLVIVAGFKNSSFAFATPTDFEVGDNVGATTGALSMFWKYAEGDETTITLNTAGGSGQIQAVCLRITDVHPSAPLNAIALADAGGGSNWNSPSINTTIDGCFNFWVGFANGGSDWVAGDEPDTSALIHQQAESTVSWFGIAYETQAVQGPTGTKQWQNAVSAKRAMSFAIAPDNTLSAGTPTGTQSSGSISPSCTTLTSNGTARIVLDTTANMAGITHPQVMAGHRNNNTSALRSSSTITVSTTTISAGTFSGLADGAYTLAAAQIDAADNESNVLTWNVTVNELGTRVQIINTGTGVASATLPAHQAGDLFIAYASIDGSNTPPVVPTGQGWAAIAAGAGANTCAAVTGFLLATGDSHESGTWTNATSLVIVQLRPRAGFTLDVGAFAQTGGSGTTVTYPGITLENADGSSRLLGYAGHRSVNTSLETPPAGMSFVVGVVDATDEAVAHATPFGVTSWSNTNVNVGGTSSGWRACTVEVLAVAVVPSGPTISGGTPTGTTTDRTPSVGFTTDVIDGTGYVVISLSAMPDIAAEQIAAGTDDNDVALPAMQVFSNAIASTSFTADQSEVGNLAGGTWYAYGVHDGDDAGEFSNVLAWTFTIPPNPGLRVEGLHRPNQDTLVADAVGVDAAVYDAFGGAELWQGTVSIVGGDVEIDSDSVGDVGDERFLILRWEVVVGEETEERVFGQSINVIDLDL